MFTANENIGPWSNTIAKTLLSSFVLLFTAYYNHFPLVTSDSGAYIYSAFSLEVNKLNVFRITYK